MTPERMQELRHLMDKMPVSWAKRWCKPDWLGCCCLGCANQSGGLQKAGFTEQEWLEWKSSPFAGEGKE